MDIVKSEVITVASCSPTSKPKSKETQKNSRKGVRFHGHEKWSPVSETNASARFQGGGNRIWRFKHIAFPWLPKPSKRTATEDSRKQKQNKMVSIQGSRVLRTHSAPKSLGAEFRGRQSIRQTFETSHVQNCDVAANEREKTEKDDEINISSLLNPRKRRISLPDFGTDGMRLREKAVIEELLRDQYRLTLKSDHKKLPPDQTISTEKVEDNLFDIKKNIKENRKFSIEDSVNIKSSEIVEERKPRSYSFELPNVTKLTLHEDRTSIKPLEQKLEQNVPYKASRKELEVKKITIPDAFFVPIQAGDESVVVNYNNDEDHESEDRLSSSEPSLAHLSHPEIRLSAEILPFNITIQEIIRNELQAQLETREFCVERCQNWCKEICQAVKQKVQDLRSDTYKVVCVVYVGALRGHGVHASVQSLWSPRQDNFTAVSYQNSSLFAVASVLAIKFE